MSAALCRAVISVAAQCTYSKGEMCPQIQKSVAQTPFKVLCHVLSRVVFRGPGGAGLQTGQSWAVAVKMCMSAGTAPAGEQCLLWLEVTLEENLCLFC